MNSSVTVDLSQVGPWITSIALLFTNYLALRSRRQAAKASESAHPGVAAAAAPAQAERQWKWPEMRYVMAGGLCLLGGLLLTDAVALAHMMALHLEPVIDTWAPIASASSGVVALGGAALCRYV